MRVKVTNKINANKVTNSIKRSKIKSLADATRYTWRVVHNSIAKRSGRTKKYNMQIYDNNMNPLMTVKQYLSRNKEQGRVVLWSNPGTGRKKGRGNVRQMELTGSRVESKSAPSGSLPYSWKLDTTTAGKKTGWQSYWLRESIKFDVAGGLIFSSPAHVTRALPIPYLLERGGQSISSKKHVVGYWVRTRQFKKGTKHVTFSEIYDRKTKRVNISKRPFMQPGLKKAAEKLPTIYAKNMKELY